MATGPTNFTANKTSAYPGETLTLTWTAAAGDFDKYRLYGVREQDGAFLPTVYLEKNKTSATVVYPEDAEPGYPIRYILEAHKDNSSVGDTAILDIMTIRGGESPDVPDTPDEPEVTEGMLEQFQNSQGQNVYPRTVLDGVFRRSDGKNLAELLDGSETPEDAVTVTGGARMELEGSFGSAPYIITVTPEDGDGAAGVESFNGRTGAVMPQSGDYTAAQVGAVPVSRTINGKALSSNITLFSCGTSDLTPGVSALAAGTLYGVYEV